jgi:hypothetical protein
MMALLEYAALSGDGWWMRKEDAMRGSPLETGQRAIRIVQLQVLAAIMSRDHDNG